MMAISTKGRYSMRILVLMASQPLGHIFTKDGIAEGNDISPAYVQQLMMTLKATGFVNSHRGKVGGFTLTRPPETITVCEVLKAVEGKVLPVPCLGMERCKHEHECIVRPVWVKAAAALEELFGAVTIAQLIEDGKTAGRLWPGVLEPARVD